MELNQKEKTTLQHSKLRSPLPGINHLNFQGKPIREVLQQSLTITIKQFEELFPKQSRLTVRTGPIVKSSSFLLAARSFNWRINEVLFQFYVSNTNKKGKQLMNQDS